MARVNSFQEQIEIESLKPKIKKAMIEQAKREKGKRWIPVPDSFGNLIRLEK